LKKLGLTNNNKTGEVEPRPNNGYQEIAI